MHIKQMRTWAEVSESALVSNINAIKARAGSAALMGVVKANAYGHGAVRAAKILAREGARYLAVAMLAEAIELREAGIDAPVLVLGVTPPDRLFVSDLLYYNVTPTVADAETAEAYSDIARNLGKTLRCHLKLDTGMGRLGFADVNAAVAAVRLPNLDVEGVFTHFAVSDAPDGAEFTRLQYERFSSAVAEIERGAGRKFALRHAANTGATLNYPEAHLDMVRPGIMLYGYPQSTNLTPVMELKSRVSDVHSVRAGETVSYGRRFTATRPTKIAVLPVGYGDGLSRGLSGRFSVLLNGRAAPQVGTICMDMCMLDVTDIPGVKAGDVATVFGRESGFTAEDMANLRNTISYEVLCNIAHRVPRIYI
ncbi:MAG: alanine racemase [Oscillospiraceae bacterium]|jgi:alanine racemase|nr:alanine racemase [Oscillospiraceae bacterium]